MILIVGGAGYIGSHINKELNKEGFETVVFDNLYSGKKELVKWGEFFEGDLGKIESIREVFKKYKIEAVLHFAAYKAVGESVTDPQKYYKNNVANTLNLFEVMKENGVNKFIFSSSAATFGEPKYIPIDEKHPQNPINPYGETKLIVEHIIRDYDKAYGMKYVALRYFNACGADLEADVGEWPGSSSNLIPLVLDAAIGRREDIKVFGTDYETPDGTCVRDYIHVTDLATAHVLALKYLLDGKESQCFNLGNGKGFSVKEVIDMAKKITGIDFKVTEVERRAGDPPELVADSKLAREILKWEPRYADLETIVSSAWKWHQKVCQIIK
ncbi:MAG: UDP-glucose 4-epimerase GalE [Candidatus Shapirobacteria bacterium]|nr:UDP-glucose 4-epimerase GalE [Candidatus Shapirobacteria bacterium]